MEETVFFNLGNAIASNFDTKELERTAQIEHMKRNGLSRLVIVTDPNKPEEEHILFDLSDKKLSAENATAFKVTKIIEKDKPEG
ncbi:hypothetical protein DOK76_12550 [Vagococcus sp. DIV0080]|uniref:Uncharacterized protein n=1 Tax=Candidatus Vagococcus giribetii TaxID=2230876 RepID=A0ABS3HVY4_9ENTE|nr:hypothetical protein [Vagococcus sp. DIV0080]MBO0477904.1 hypothetical protein [Vagococcus sp. DIV0080]